MMGFVKWVFFSMCWCLLVFSLLLGKISDIKHFFKSFYFIRSYTYLQLTYTSFPIPSYPETIPSIDNTSV